MANVFAKSGRDKSVFYVGSIKLDKEFVDTGLSNAEFKANPILSEALNKGLILVGLPDDDVADEVVMTEPEPDDNDGLPDDKESLQEIADSYGLEYNPQLGAKKLKALILSHLDAE